VVLGLWHLPEPEGGTTSRIVLALHILARIQGTDFQGAKFLVGIKSIKADVRPEAVMPTFTEESPQEAQPQSAGGRGHALPDSAYTGS
jgi:hypothetical protein